MYKSQALRSYTSLGQIVIYLVSTAATASISAIYTPVVCIHCSPPTGMGGEIGFTFQSPGISPALWGQADDNNPALAPPYTTENPSRVGVPMLYPLTSPALRGQSKNNCPAPYPGYSTAIPVGRGRGYK